jgi:hypothetical protein
MSFVYRHHEQDVGPLSREEFLQRYRSGAMQPDTPARHVESTQWQSAEQLVQHLEQTQNATAAPATVWRESRKAEVIFRDLQKLTLLLGILLLLTSFGSFFMHGEDSRMLAQIKEASQGRAEAPISQAELEAIQAKGSPLIALIFPIALLSTILSLIWTYRAAVNVRVLGANGLQFSPGWAVAVYFIPLVNLVAPFLVLREIAKASVDAKRWSTQRAGALVYLWWPLIIVSGILSQLSIGAMLNLDGVAQVERLHQLSSYSLPALTLLNIISFLLYWQIALSQARQANAAG